MTVTPQLVGAALSLVACLSLLSTTMYYRSLWKDCQANEAIVVAKAEAQVNTAKAADAQLRKTIEDNLAPVLRSLEEQRYATAVALAKVPSNPACSNTPAARAFDNSVRVTKPSSPGAGEQGPTRP